MNKLELFLNMNDKVMSIIPKLQQVKILDLKASSILNRPVFEFASDHPWFNVIFKVITQNLAQKTYSMFDDGTIISHKVEWTIPGVDIIIMTEGTEYGQFDWEFVDIATFDFKVVRFFYATKRRQESNVSLMKLTVHNVPSIPSHFIGNPCGDTFSLDPNPTSVDPFDTTKLLFTLMITTPLNAIFKPYELRVGKKTGITGGVQEIIWEDRTLFLFGELLTLIDYIVANDIFMSNPLKYKNVPYICAVVQANMHSKTSDSFSSSFKGLVEYDYLETPLSSNFMFFFHADVGPPYSDGQACLATVPTPVGVITTINTGASSGLITRSYNKSSPMKKGYHWSILDKVTTLSVPFPIMAISPAKDEFPLANTGTKYYCHIFIQYIGLTIETTANFVNNVDASMRFDIHNKTVRYLNHGLMSTTAKFTGSELTF